MNANKKIAGVVLGAWMVMTAGAGAQTAVLFSLQQMTGSPLKRQITVTSLDGVRIVGTNTVFPEVKVLTPGTNGTVTTNLLTGNYRATVKGLSGYVDGFVPDTNVTVSWASDCASIPAGSVNLPSYYTKAQVDAAVAAATGRPTTNAADLVTGTLAVPRLPGVVVTNEHAAPVTLKSNLTVQGSSTYQQITVDEVVLTGTGTNEIGLSTFTNVAPGKFLYQGSDGVVVGVDDPTANVASSTWAGPTNAIALTSALGREVYVAESDCAVTNVTGLTAGKTRSTYLTVSNAAASAITLRFTGSGRPIGSATTNALSIAAGKTGDLLMEGVAGMVRYTTAVEQ